MSLANFTPDAICRKMGLTGFVADPAFVAERNALRVLLYPVFHPKTCITLSVDADVALLSIVCASDSVFAPHAEGAALSDQEECMVDAVEAAQLLEDFRATVIHWPNNGSCWARDGMLADFALIRDGRIEHLLNYGPGPDSSRALVDPLISLAWRSITQIACKNALSDAGNYVGLRLIK